MMKFNYGNAVFRLCIDRDCSGIVAGLRLREAIPFSDMLDLVMKLEQIMDAQDYPRAFQSKRTFSSVAPIELPFALEDDEMMAQAVVDSHKGESATLLLHVITRQNSSWQGTVKCAVTGREEKFESVLKFFEVVNSFIGRE